MKLCQVLPSLPPFIFSAHVMSRCPNKDIVRLCTELRILPFLPRIFLKGFIVVENFIHVYDIYVVSGLSSAPSASSLSPL